MVIKIFSKIILSIVLVMSSILSYGNDMDTTSTNTWVALTNWTRTTPGCNYGCVDMWYSLYYDNNTIDAARVQYSFVFQSNSKWDNGVFANTVIKNVTVYIDGKAVVFWDYPITVGYSDYGKQTLTFGIQQYFIRPNSVITFNIGYAELR